MVYGNETGIVMDHLFLKKLNRNTTNYILKTIYEKECKKR